MTKYGFLKVSFVFLAFSCGLDLCRTSAEVLLAEIKIGVDLVYMILWRRIDMVFINIVKTSCCFGEKVLLIHCSLD